MFRLFVFFYVFSAADKFKERLRDAVQAKVSYFLRKKENHYFLIYYNNKASLLTNKPNCLILDEIDGS